jgi:hypothetical protein
VLVLIAVSTATFLNFLDLEPGAAERRIGRIMVRLLDLCSVEGQSRAAQEILEEALHAVPAVAVRVRVR